MIWLFMNPLISCESLHASLLLRYDVTENCGVIVSMGCPYVFLVDSFLSTIYKSNFGSCLSSDILKPCLTDYSPLSH